MFSNSSWFDYQDEEKEGAHYFQCNLSITMKWLMNSKYKILLSQFCMLNSQTGEGKKLDSKAEYK